MAKLEWDKIGERVYETGVDRGVLYVFDSEEEDYGEGKAWNGLIGVSESPTGAEPNPQYADNIKYLNLVSAEEFEGSIEAFTYPDEFAACDGSVEHVPGMFVSQQPRKMFGLTYRTMVGSDTDGLDFGYKIHIIYGALATPTDKSYGTQSDSPEAITFNWDITTTKVPVPGFKPTAALIIESWTSDPDALKELENILYGVNGNVDEGITEVKPSLPMPGDILALFADNG